ncbi:YbhB/YbcL family Raf kinase inhibitor-like protein [Hyphomicrobium sp. CS1GBMeth3]|uniref:YbhB/YbcL family Raf kinase inhibitor-like protein n=1 Tax=Hyphomicrobium sp. CS1GBMeth3 TaxID=1892845 RepID=UPI00093170EA|nr:YbhB/YbcL family Raf kinase inhibitor-like protein [Hyphomicrobium sp. CS1GBMeth3]
MFGIKAFLVLAFGALCALGGAGLAYLYANKQRYALAPSVTSMRAEIGLEKAHTCSSLSPPIRVQGVPPDTARIAVEVTDLNLAYSHGGGVVVPPPGGVISEGSLSEYMGPCPGVEEHAYRFRLNALSATNKIIGIAEVVKECCGQVK